MMQKAFCLDDKYLIVKADERLGRFLLNEIMLSGNFGFYDKRIDKYRGSQLKKNIQRLVRDARFMLIFPSESLWEPVFRLYHSFGEWLPDIRQRRHGYAPTAARAPTCKKQIFEVNVT